MHGAKQLWESDIDIARNSFGESWICSVAMADEIETE